jgi:hypothetical protein
MIFEFSLQNSFIDTPDYRGIFLLANPYPETFRRKGKKNYGIFTGSLKIII